MKRDGRSTAVYCFNVIIPVLCDGTRVFCFCFAHSVVSRISQNHDSPPHGLLIKSSVNKCKYSLKTPSKDINAFRMRRCSDDLCHPLRLCYLPLKKIGSTNR